MEQQRKTAINLPLPPGGTPLYKLYKYVPLHRVGFLRRFGLTTGIHFAHFGLEWGHERNLFFDSLSSRGKKIFNKEVFLALKNYLFLRVSADKFQPPIIWPCIDKNGWCFKFYINSLLFMSLGRPICKELRQRTHSINSSRSQLRRQQFEANIHVRDPMDWGILILFN